MIREMTYLIREKNQHFKFKCKINLDANFVETIVPLKDFEAFAIIHNL